MTLDIDAELAAGARLMWVAAHPDDEFLTGALLARARLVHNTPVHICIMTRGSGGGNPIVAADLGATRAGEMQAVADRLGATLEVHDYWNAPLPFSSFPSRPELYRRWQAQGDPQADIAASIRAFAPDIVLTFDPDFGATGHPEHTLVSRLTTSAVRSLSAETRPRLVLHALRRHWAFRLMRQADPGPVDAWFDGGLPCVDGKTCQQTLVELTLLHATQAGDLAPFRRFSRLFQPLGLRVVDVDTRIDLPEA